MFFSFILIPRGIEIAVYINLVITLDKGVFFPNDISAIKCPVLAEISK